MMTEREPRAAKYGRLQAMAILQIISSMPKWRRENYKARFLQELRTYSFEPGHDDWELIDIDETDIRNPRDLARLVKEGAHLMYQKGTSKNYMNSLIKYIRNNQK